MMGYQSQNRKKIRRGLHSKTYQLFLVFIILALISFPLVSGLPEKLELPNTKEGLAKDHPVFMMINSIKELMAQEQSAPLEAPPEPKDEPIPKDPNNTVTSTKQTENKEVPKSDESSKASKPGASALQHDLKSNKLDIIKGANEVSELSHTV